MKNPLARIQLHPETLSLAFTSVLVFALPMSGCGGGSQPSAVEFKDQTVIGRVVLGNGQPLTKGRVVLTPVKASDAMLYGKLGPGGAYTLSTAGLGLAGKGLGVTHGEFRVSVETDNYLPGVKPKGLNFPAKYLDPATSGLTATISADTKSLNEIQLK